MIHTAPTADINDLDDDDDDAYRPGYSITTGERLLYKPHNWLDLVKTTMAADPDIIPLLDGEGTGSIIERTMRAEEILGRYTADPLKVAYAIFQSRLGWSIHPKETDAAVLADKIKYGWTEGMIESLIESGVEWAAGADVEADAIIPGVLAAGGLANMAGDGKVGKSWLAYSLALAVANGVDWLGAHPVATPGRVLIIAAEGGRKDTRARIRGLALGMGLDPDEAMANIDVAWKKNVALDDLVWFIPELTRVAPRYKLIVCDVLRNLWDGDESNEAFGRLCRGLLPVQTAGATVMLLHHAVKTSETSRGRNSFQNMRGGSTLRNAHDSGFFLERGKDANRTTVQLETRAGAPAANFTFAWPLTTQDGSEPIDLDWQSDSRRIDIQTQEDAAIKFATENPGLSMEALSRLMPGNFSRRRDAIRGLIENQTLEARPATGRRGVAIYVSHTETVLPDV